MNCRKEGPFGGRLGFFVIPSFLIDKDPLVVRKIMGEVVVVRAEAKFHLDGVEYLAYSPWFDKVSAGSCASEYTFILSRGKVVGCRRI